MPLTGIRVLDLSRLLPGAYCTMLLADLGAEVIKVEEPGTGDYIPWTPPLGDGQSALFNAINRNKRSESIHLITASSRDVRLSSCYTAHVFFEANRPVLMILL